MALALLDYLFDRDTQACSNLSGLGRHGKKKLDPLFIYGLRCAFFSVNSWLGIYTITSSASTPMVRAACRLRV